VSAPRIVRVLQVHTRYRHLGGEDSVVEAERRLLEGAGVRVDQVLFDNADRRWAPGLYVTAAVLLDESSVPLAIRSEALQTLEGRSVVFVQTDDGFAPRAVELGRSDGEHAEVVSGLEPGVRYVAKNSFILKAELGKGEAEHGH